jgi:pyruvate dehydrogenase E2 component (dihydrolipoamide acetyltransferase)
MAVPIEMPKPGVTVEECLLIKWHRKPGETVAAGDMVAEIETDKATFEVAAPEGGVLLARFFDEGELVPVYTNICVIGGSGEDFERYRPSARTPETAPAVQERPAEAARQTEPPAPLSGFMSPRARQFAARHDFHPQNLAGSGPGGRLLEADVREAYFESPRIPGLRADDRIRERIARRMRESLASTAQYTLHSSADATALLGSRCAAASRPAAWTRISTSTKSSPGARCGRCCATPS